jgi:hypothetical protein
MPFFVPALIAGASALAGALSNKEKDVKQTGSSTTNSTQTSTGATNFTNTPTYDPLQLQMRNYLLQNFFERAQPGAVDGLVDSTVNGGINNINSAGASNEMAIKNMLASRGLSYSPAAATPLAIANSNRLAQTTQLRNSAPILADQLQTGRLTSFANFLSGLPTGQTGVTNTASTTEGAQHTDSAGNVIQPSNMLGGAVSNAAGTLAYLYGQGAFGGSKK